MLEPKQEAINKIRRSAGLWTGVVILVSGMGLSLWLAWFVTRPPLAPPKYQVSQQGREFRPSRLDVNTGDVVRIVNDDGDLSHHSYIASPRFSFDSGDQEPGRNVDIPFTVAGTYNVLCGIHPKMRLVVNVH